MPETGWQHSRGIDGRNPLDWVATFPWITWQHSRGLGGRNPWNTQSACDDSNDDRDGEVPAQSISTHSMVAIVPLDVQKRKHACHFCLCLKPDNHDGGAN